MRLRVAGISLMTLSALMMFLANKTDAQQQPGDACWACFHNTSTQNTRCGSSSSGAINCVQTCSGGSCWCDLGPECLLAFELEADGSASSKQNPLVSITAPGELPNRTLNVAESSVVALMREQRSTTRGCSDIIVARSYPATIARTLHERTRSIVL